MTFPKPIRYDIDTWLVMRTDPVLPKAVIQRVHGTDGDRYLLHQWDLDPAKRMLRGVYESLERANDKVLYDVSESGKPDAPRGETHGFMSDAELREPASRKQKRIATKT